MDVVHWVLFRFPIQITSDIDLASLMNSLMLAQGKLEA